MTKVRWGNTRLALGPAPPVARNPNRAALCCHHSIGGGAGFPPLFGLLVAGIGGGLEGQQQNSKSSPEGIVLYREPILQPYYSVTQFLGLLPVVYPGRQKRNIKLGIATHILLNLINALAYTVVLLA